MELDDGRWTMKKYVIWILPTKINFGFKCRAMSFIAPRCALEKIHPQI